MANKGKKIGPMRHHTHEEVAAAIIAARGLATDAAAMLRCSRETICNHIEKSELCRLAQEKATEIMLDLAENKLFKAIQKESPWAVSFFLGRKGRKRQYNDKLDVTSGEKPLHGNTSELDAVLQKLGAAGLKKIIEELEKGK